MAAYELSAFQSEADGAGEEVLTQYDYAASFGDLPSTQDGLGTQGGGITSGLNGEQQNGAPGGVPGRPSPVPASSAAPSGTAPAAAGATAAASGKAGGGSGAANGSAGAGVEGLSAAMSEMSFDDPADEDAGEYQSAEAPEHACR